MHNNQILPFEFKIATYRDDQSTYYHEICNVGKHLEFRGLQNGMRLIRVNNMECSSQNQIDVVNTIISMNFIQIETDFGKVKFRKYLGS